MVRATKRENRPLRGAKNIAVRADRALRAHKVGKHFATTGTEDSFPDNEKAAVREASVSSELPSLGAGRSERRRDSPGRTG